MANDYSSHVDYMKKVGLTANKREIAMQSSLRIAFSKFLVLREVEVIVFDNINGKELALIIESHPDIFKPLIALCNVAARSIERDLGIKNLDTYNPRISGENAIALAAYLKPFLPNYVELPTLSTLDRISFIDKEIRATKGSWEKVILNSLNEHSKSEFKKRLFKCSNGKFELDAASPTSGPIAIGIDIKRVEARRDIHKRCDEIVNKASKFKSEFPMSKFAAVVYYPFTQDHQQVSTRLRSEEIDAVAFAGETLESIENSVRLLLKELKLSK